jgi:hypothetical protein
VGIDIVPLKRGGRKSNLPKIGRRDPLGGNVCSCTVQIDENARQAGQQWIQEAAIDMKCYFSQN